MSFCTTPVGVTIEPIMAPVDGAVVALDETGPVVEVGAVVPEVVPAIEAPAEPPPPPPFEQATRATEDVARRARTGRARELISGNLFRCRRLSHRAVRSSVRLRPLQTTVDR